MPPIQTFVYSRRAAHDVLLANESAHGDIPDAHTRLCAGCWTSIKARTYRAVCKTFADNLTQSPMKPHLEAPGHIALLSNALLSNALLSNALLQLLSYRAYEPGKFPTHLPDLMDKIVEMFASITNGSSLDRYWDWAWCLHHGSSWNGVDIRGPARSLWFQISSV
jgi:hypothetical protein